MAFAERVVNFRLSVSVAQLDTRPTGDQEVAGLKPPPPTPRSPTFFRGD